MAKNGAACAVFYVQWVGTREYHEFFFRESTERWGLSGRSAKRFANSSRALIASVLASCTGLDCHELGIEPPDFAKNSKPDRSKRA